MPHFDSIIEWRKFRNSGLRLRGSIEDFNASDVQTIHALNALYDLVRETVELVDEPDPQKRWPAIQSVHRQVEQLYLRERERFEPVRRSLDAQGGSMRIERRSSPHQLTVIHGDDEQQRDFAYCIAALEVHDAVSSQYADGEHQPADLAGVWQWIEDAIGQARRLYATIAEGHGEDQPPPALPFPG